MVRTPSSSPLNLHVQQSQEATAHTSYKLCSLIPHSYPYNTLTTALGLENGYHWK